MFLDDNVFYLPTTSQGAQHDIEKRATCSRMNSMMAEQFLREFVENFGEQRDEQVVDHPRHAITVVDNENEDANHDADTDQHPVNRLSGGSQP